jgi:tRNA (guanine37-N1)-methyltransferase
MKFSIITLFPEMLKSIMETSIIGRAVEKGLLSINYVNLRDYSVDKHRKVDDYPFGGGPGMLLKPEPLYNAITSLKEEKTKVIYMSPKGKRLDQILVNEFSKLENIMIIAGHYEGMDQRIIDNYVDESISIGDYVLTGGELPAAVLIDSVARLIPGVLTSEDSYISESHYDILLEHPQYTRPREFNGLTVPEILLSGNHKEIEKWQRFKSLETTIKNRPDLIEDKEDLLNEYEKLKQYFT